MRIFNHSNSYKNRRKSFVMLIIIFLLLSLHGSPSIAMLIDSPNIGDMSNSVNDKYIIKFTEEPLSIFENRVKTEMKNLFPHLTEKLFNEILDRQVLQHKNKILLIHQDVKEAILELVNRNLEDVFSREFTVLFNGMTIKKTPDAILEKIKNLPNVKDVIPDYRITVTLNDSIPLINADDAWDLYDKCGESITGQGVTVAVIDTGLDYTHPDLKDNFVDGYDFVNNDNDPMDDNGHGTHCAGVIAGTGMASDFRFVGVAPNAKLYIYKAMDDRGSGYASWFIESMERAVDPNMDGDFSDHVDVMSISAGDSSGYPGDALSVAADNAADLGVVVVVAAGNDGPSYNSISSPGCAQKVICVGATDKKGEIAAFSSRGSDFTETVKPDVVAPGVDITSTWPGGAYRALSGTSMACPHVAGIVALLLQMHPHWTSDEIKTALRDTAVDIGYNLTTQGYGQIDALNAVTLSGTTPIAILNISCEIGYGSVDIHGMALADDFQNYSLHYTKVNESEQSTDWINLYEGDREVNCGILFTWDTCSLHSGNYKLKLEVRSQNQTSVDIAFISLKTKNDSQKLFIQSPDEINEFECFTVSVTDINDTPQMAWFLLTFPHNRPKIRFGVSANFKAPLILNPQIESLEGTLTVFKISGRYKINRMHITVVNK